METFGHKGNNVYLSQFVFLRGNKEAIKFYRLGDKNYYRISNVILLSKIESPDKDYGIYKLDLYDGTHIELALDSSVQSEKTKLTQVADIDKQVNGYKELLITDIIQNTIISNDIIVRLVQVVKPKGIVYDLTVY